MGVTNQEGIASKFIRGNQEGNPLRPEKTSRIKNRKKRVL